jgi:uncharacterized phage protein (TIGR01671 family)
MREILFRGKRKDNGEWVYGFYRDYIYRKKKHAWIETIDRTWEIDPETRGEYIGRIDCKGVKIFHEDIVKDTHNNIGVVKYSEHFLDWRIHFYKGLRGLTKNNEYGYDIFDWVYPIMRLEVIANIHDDKNLLLEDTK